MAIPNIVNTKQNKKKKYVINPNKKIDLSKFDPYTGEKVATPVLPMQNQPVSPDVIKKRKLEALELRADANRTQTQPVDWLHSAKSGTVGATGAYVLANLFNLKRRTQGLASLALGGLIAGLDAKRQISNYNRQMAAREVISGVNTPRAQAYTQMLRNKYEG